MSLKSAPVIINSKTLKDTFHFNKACLCDFGLHKHSTHNDTFPNLFLLHYSYLDLEFFATNHTLILEECGAGFLTSLCHLIIEQLYTVS